MLVYDNDLNIPCVLDTLLIIMLSPALRDALFIMDKQ